MVVEDGVLNDDDSERAKESHSKVRFVVLKALE